ncbi:MAG: hypothetical protein WB797_05945 [Nocardioides sp.]
MPPRRTAVLLASVSPWGWWLAIPPASLACVSVEAGAYQATKPCAVAN